MRQDPRACASGRGAGGVRVGRPVPMVWRYVAAPGDRQIRPAASKRIGRYSWVSVRRYGAPLKWRSAAADGGERLVGVILQEGRAASVRRKCSHRDRWCGAQTGSPSASSIVAPKWRARSPCDPLPVRSGYPRLQRQRSARRLRVESATFRPSFTVGRNPYARRRPRNSTRVRVGRRDGSRS